MRRPQATADTGLLAHAGTGGFIAALRIPGQHSRTPYTTDAPLLLAGGGADLGSG
jgi:hypothetical protein